MSDSPVTDVLVVGNGVVGTSIAYELARREPRTTVTVVGPRARAGGATMAAGAMLNAFGEVTKYTLASEPGRAKFELCRQALDRWSSWLDEIVAVSGHDHVRGSLSSGTTVLFNAKSGHLDDANFAALLAAADEYGEPCDEVAAGDVPGLDPIAEARPLRAVHLPREGAVDSRAVLGALEVAAERLGVRVVDAAVQGTVVEGGRVTGVELADGSRLVAGTVVLAAGAFTGTLLSAALPPGSVPLMFSGKGIALQTRRQVGPGFEHVVRTPNRSGSCGLHLAPLGGGIEYVGATNLLFDEPALVPDAGMSEFLMQVAREQLDQKLFFSDVERWLVGNRPVALDGFPLVGRTSVEGLVVATGTYRDGFHCSPVLAEMVIDDLLGTRALADQLPLFRPERPLRTTFTPEEAITEFAFHGVSASVEAGLRLPSHSDTSMLEFYYRAAAQRFYDLVEHPVGLSPEVLLGTVFAPDLAEHRVVRYLADAHARHAVAA